MTRKNGSHAPTIGRGVPVANLTRFVPIIGAAVSQLQMRATQRKAAVARTDASILQHLADDLCSLRSLIASAESDAGGAS